ncbi:hypothetical protein LJC36_02510 [Desulfovibrio sp. OttesenSCG-928-C14]|nr:hypothetical protein [Desulfovibrio sp. OttesenSCG-928-C14]
MCKGLPRDPFFAKQSIDKNMDNVEISTTIYNDLKIGEITVQAAFGNHILYVKVSQVEEEKSKVEIYLKGVNPGASAFFNSFGCMAN